MTNQVRRSVICRYDGQDEYGRGVSKKTKAECQEWCEPGVTCNLPHDPLRDELGFYELEERQHLNRFLLERWNEQMRSPYCQCKYSSGKRPTTAWCDYCQRPSYGEVGIGSNKTKTEEDRNYEHNRRLRAGPTWFIVYESTVRAAEIALKLLIKATSPEPEHGIRHNLRALWHKVPDCAKNRVNGELTHNHYLDDTPFVITAEGNPIPDQLPLLEQPVFDQFAAEFNNVRYAWEKLHLKGMEETNEQAKEWPNPIKLYYLHIATEAVLAVLKTHLWDIESTHIQRNRRVQSNIGLEDYMYHTDWPPRYVIEEPIVIDLKSKRRSA